MHMNKKTIFALLLLILNISTAFAQFIQEGATLEYKGNKAKVPYTNLVSLDFAGAVNTVNEKGNFSLRFNQLSSGNMVGEFKITIGDKQYVLFNKPIIQRWILTNDAKMEVLLCRKSHIDNLVNTYTKAHVSKLEKQYNEAKEEIEKQISANKRLEQDVHELVRELSELKNHYEIQIATIRANAIMFAYVDETKLDSLERVKRNCILHNDIEKAIEIGREIDYSKIANNLINNATLSQASYRDNINQLFSVADYIQQHIDNCFNVNKTWFYGYIWGEDKKDIELAGYFQILANIYEYLIEQYTTFIRCDEKFLYNLKQNYGDILFRIAFYSDLSKEKYIELLEKAADFDSPEALYKLGTTEKDFYKARSYLKRCIEAVNDDLLKDVAKERYESFPDFLYITKERDSIYCHIISDSEKKVNICDFHLGEKRDIIKIPSKVKYKGKTYTITKVGFCSFRNICCNDWDNSPFQHKTSDEFRKISGKIILPNTITEIGREAFHLQTSLSAIEFPQTLKIIKDYAFNDCWDLKSIFIPEGVEEIGQSAFNNYGWAEAMWSKEEATSISLPSTLRTLHQNSFSTPYLSDLKLSKNNLHFQLINGVLYSADSTILYRNLIPINTEVLFVPDNISVNEIDLYPSDSLKRFKITPTHKFYSEYKDIIYSKDFSSIISIPRDIDWIELHPNLKYEPNFLHRTVDGLSTINTRKVIISQDLNPNIKYSLYCNYIAQECSHSTEKTIKLYDEQHVEYSLKDVINKASDCLDNNKLDSLLLSEYSHIDYEECHELYGKQLYKIATTYNNAEHWIKFSEYKAKYGQIQDVIIDYQKAGLNNKEISNRLVDIGNQYYRGDIEKCISQNYSIAFNYFKKATELDSNNIAACNIAIMYHNGLFVNKNIIEAIKWYEQAICWGANYDRPYMELGNIYYHGLDRVADYIKAFSYFEIAANMGNADALNYLGIISNNGLSKSKDIEQAIKYYTQAIEKGDKRYAPGNLGAIYYNELAYKDYEKAYSYFKIAEENKNTAAMNMIAYMKALAQGTEHNLVEALYHINKAITISPDNISYWDSKGEILLMSDRLGDARLIMHDMMEKDSSGVENLRPQSNFLKAMQYNTKEEIYLKMLELGDSINSPYILGNLFFQNKELTKAKTYYEIASKNGNDNAKVALYIVKNLIQEEQDIWISSLIRIWQHTPIKTSSPINEISFTLDGNKIVGNSRNNTCYIWNSNGEALLYVHKYGTQKYARYNKAIFDPTGKYLIIENDENRTAQVWDVENNTLLYSITHYDGLYRRACFNNNGTFYFSCNRYGLDIYDKCVLRLRETESGRIVFSKNLQQSLNFAGFSPDGNYIIAIARTLIYIWDSKTGNDVQTYDFKHSYREMEKAMISPDNSKMICYNHKYHYVDIWSIKTGELINTIRHNGRINDACIDSTSRYLATASADSTAAIWNLHTGQNLKTFKHDGNVSKLRFSPNGKILATSCSGIIQLWDTANGTQLRVPMKHDSKILDFNFSPDGKTIISSTENNICRLWDVNTGEEITSPYIPANWIDTIINN